MIKNKSGLLVLVSVAFFSLSGCLLLPTQADLPKADNNRIIYRDLLRAPIPARYAPKMQETRAPRLSPPPVATVRVERTAKSQEVPALQAVKPPVAPIKTAPSVLPSSNKPRALPRSPEAGCSCSIVR